MGRTSKQRSSGETHPARGPFSETAGLSERLLRATLAISRCATLEEALKPLLDAALDITRMDGGGVYWVDGEVAVLRHHRGLPQGFIREVVRMPLSPPPVQALLRQQEPVELAEISSTMRELFRRHGIRHAFSFPLRTRETVFGFLNVGSTRTKEPARRDLLALQLLVSQMDALFCRLYSEMALRESEERYRTLWQSALDGMALYELSSPPYQGRLIDVNECTCRMLGYAREELLQRSPLDLVDEESRQALPELAAQVRQSGSVLFEMTAVAKDGRRIPVEVKVSAVQFGGHRVALAILRDVTERTRAAAALQESEERFRAFMNHSPAVAWMKDEQGRYVYLSGTHESRFGLRLEDCRGKTDFDLWPREIAEVFWENDREVLRSGRVVEVVEEAPAPDGGRCYWWSFKFPFKDTSGRRFVGGIGVDIAERRQLEEDLKQLNERLERQVQIRTEELSNIIDRLQDEVARRVLAEGKLRRHSQMLEAFFQHTISPLAFLDKSFRFVRVNRAYAEAYGKHPEFFAGQDYFALHREAGDRAIFEQVVRTRQPYRDYARRFVNPDNPQQGETYWNWRLTPLLNKAGEVQALVLICEDVTRQETAMQELEHRANQLQRLTLELTEAEERERRRLAEFLHDDLQQMLAAVKFQLSVLGGRVQGDDAVRETVQSAKEMLKEAIEKSRNLSHEFGPTALFRGDLREAFEWLAGQMESRHGLTVEVNVRDPLASHSEPVRSFLYRAAQELLFDVAKHARVRAAKLRLQRVRDQLWLTVSDKGCGFDLESLDKTAGYGLTSIRERVELLGGRMRIKSAPGRGSIFFLVVPDADAGHATSP
jgi:PAS domain S-box-containing protein